MTPPAKSKRLTVTISLETRCLLSVILWFLRSRWPFVIRATRCLAIHCYYLLPLFRCAGFCSQRQHTVKMNTFHLSKSSRTHLRLLCLPAATSAYHACVLQCRGAMPSVLP